MSNPEPIAAPSVALSRGGLHVGQEELPLWAGSIHYWRLDPRHWKRCIQATKALGVRLIDVYVPWSVHEISPGELDLGQIEARHDVRAFLELVHAEGLRAIVRPGPHINAEMTYFGIPERVVWDPACQARSPRHAPVVLPMIPQAFPVPSYASEVFLDESCRYLRQISAALAPLAYPAGPIVMVQVDNEGAMYFRDGVYDQDYHPDAIALYRAFLRDKYRTLEGLAEAYGAPADAEHPLRFGDLEPPSSFDAKTSADLPRHIDWAEFQETLLSRALARMSEAIEAGGLGALPRSHNFPPGQETTPLNAARVAPSPERGGVRSVDFIGYDYYNQANPRSRALIARRTSELATRSEALNVPAFACEMGAGYPPFFPPLNEEDSAFTILCAVAYGLRGFNLYMAVERDRWIGAPIGPTGSEREFARFYRQLIMALDELNFTSLVRRVPVRILVPRNERRLARVMHAFGPISGAFFSVAGAGARESCREDELGLGYPPPVEADTFMRLLESALEARGVPFAHVGGEDRDVVLDGASWVVCLCSGGLSSSLFEELERRSAAGLEVSIGPREPTVGGARRELKQPFDIGRLHNKAGLGRLISLDPAAVEGAVGAAIEALKLPTYSVDPDTVFCTVHETVAGVPRVMFVINPTDQDEEVRITLMEKIVGARDALTGQTLSRSGRTLELRAGPRSVRMLELQIES